MLSPKRVIPHGRQPFVGELATRQCGNRSPYNRGNHEDKSPTHARWLVLEVGERLGMARRDEFAKEARDLSVERGGADGLVRKIEGKPREHSDACADNIR